MDLSVKIHGPQIIMSSSAMFLTEAVYLFYYSPVIVTEYNL